MNLLSLLLKSLMTDSALQALAKKTGLNNASLKKLLPLAVPLLIRFLTKNASSQAGALSLLGALGQHTDTKSLAEQISDADTEDGSKIIGHVLGDDTDAVVRSLSQQSGASTDQVSALLAGIAPALLSGLSAANGSASAAPSVNLSDGLDLSDLMGMFMGMQQPQQQPQQQQVPGGGLLSGLLGGGNASMGGGLLSSLLGATADAADQNSAVNGTQLLSLLSALK